MSTTYTFGPKIDLDKLFAGITEVKPENCIGPVAELFGFKFASDPRLPPNVIELRDSRGLLLKRFIVTDAK